MKIGDRVKIDPKVAKKFRIGTVVGITQYVAVQRDGLKRPTLYWPGFVEVLGEAQASED